jgi:hypothetical protein
LDGKRGETVVVNITSPSSDYDRPSSLLRSWLSDTYKLHIGFKGQPREGHTRTQARLRTQRPREGRGGRFRPYGLDTCAFFGSDLKTIAAPVAAGLSVGALVAQRRALSEVYSDMQPKSTDETTHFDEESHRERQLHPERGSE